MTIADRANAATAPRPPGGQQRGGQQRGGQHQGGQHGSGRHRSGRHAGGRPRRRAWPLTGPDRRRWQTRLSQHPAAASAAACGLLICATGLAGLVVASQGGRAALAAGRTPFVAVPDGTSAPLPDAAHPVAVAPPVTLIIPAIGVRTHLIRLGRTAAGALQVPATTAVAGWYSGSPRPGEIGAAVIAGHVDSYRGPGVFFRLHLLRPGDLILVRRADGSLATFRVLRVRLYLKSRFPISAVYGPVPAAELRVITCGGTFDPALGSYLSNVIVSAIEVRWQHQGPAARPGATSPAGHFVANITS